MADNASESSGCAGKSTETTVNQDELIMKQQRQIEREISENIPLIGGIEPLSTLEEEYSDDPVYFLKAKDLSSKYKSIRRTRPDGNCFFRAFSYAYLEQLLTDKTEYDKFFSFAQKSKDNLVSLGFSQFTVEDFYDTFMEVVQRVGANIGKEDMSEAREELHKIFNEQSYSDYVVVYLRLLTSGQLQTDYEFYQNFIEGERTISEFCHQISEVMCGEFLCTNILIAIVGVVFRVDNFVVNPEPKIVNLDDDLRNGGLNIDEKIFTTYGLTQKPQ